MALILIADDDELIAELVAEALRARGHVVGTLGDGVQVLDLVTAKRPALVVLDCAMPTMSGVEVLRQIRASPTCFDTPVLMLTGRRSEADEEIAIRAGANDYMRKPFAVDELVSRVEDLLEAGTRPGTTLFNRCRPLAGERGQASPTGEDSEPVSLRSAST